MGKEVEHFDHGITRVTDTDTGRVTTTGELSGGRSYEVTSYSSTRADGRDTIFKDSDANGDEEGHKTHHGATDSWNYHGSYKK
ncbi:hypothetical protein KUK79_004615 [Vibrio parahaemolyticus]|uniref:hypothetical protein n=1 Tax=Vibrio parahaemolyticus TaxID=670 RepID=UPI00084B3B14|nr:hypothetical protein [Vibrio parahaemolyticus]EHR6179903.1 hypothetical protein [Vibrio parahaemolyticus]ODY35025.1 hypothetical protein BBM21_03655 [Vibrio parahaemolyticus]